MGFAVQWLFVGLLVYFALSSDGVYVAGWPDPFYFRLSTGQLLAIVVVAIVLLGFSQLAVGLWKNKLGLVARGCDTVGAGLGVILMSWLVATVLEALGFRPGNAAGELAAAQLSALKDIAAPIALNVGLMSALGGQLIAGGMTQLFCEQGPTWETYTRHAVRIALLGGLGVAIASAMGGQLVLFEDYITSTAAAALPR